MLDKMDLLRNMEKKEYKHVIHGLEIKLGELQREARTAGIPVIIVFEGWDAAGKGTLINNLMLTLDPRGCNVYPINEPTQEETLRPFLWRFWTKTPENGRIAIFDRSWYGKVLVERVDKIARKNEWKRAYEEINIFERQLTDSGAVIIKFFLHISKKEQARRFKKIKESEARNWKVRKEDLKHHKQYDKYLSAIEDMLAKTDTGNAPWNIVESFDFRFATVKIFNTVIDAIQNELLKRNPLKPVKAKKEKPVGDKKLISRILDKIDLTKTLSTQEYDVQLKKYQERLSELEHIIYTRRIPVMIVFEGWDAAGKGGAIRRLATGLDPRGYTVVPFAAPTDSEKRHHYLWRFWQHVPKAGHITIFDRSWYGRVLVERVENFCSETEWKRSYQEINEMEEQFAEAGSVMVKFWLHIDKEEQLKRFQERESIGYKNWKITPEDYRNREKWEDYETAVNEMILRTSTAHAPWEIIEANSKHYARVKVLKTVIEAIEEKL